jgi:hypothetical protein
MKSTHQFSWCVHHQFSWCVNHQFSWRVNHQKDSLKSEDSKKIKRKYTSKENEFLIECDKNLAIEDKKDLLDHFEHSPERTVKRGEITIEEQQLILKYVCEKGKQLQIF